MFVLVEGAVLFIFLKLFFMWVEDFKIGAKRLIIFVFILGLFAVGFGLRVSGEKSLIDLGYFLTEFCTLAVTVLLVICMFLGQVKYWKC